MFKKFAIIGALALSALTASPQTFAQSIEIGPDGLKLKQPDSTGEAETTRRGIDDREAVRIARHEGLRQVDSVRRRGSAYIVEGADRRGNDMRVSIDRRSGEVISVD